MTDFYVAAAGGVASGAGGIGAPWTLAHALSHPAAVQPGDTIYLRGGVYGSDGDHTINLDGTAGNPITLRGYPGEKAEIRGTFVRGDADFIRFQDLDISFTTPVVNDGNFGINARGEGWDVINCVIHDTGMTGLGHWVEAPNSEIRGNIIYNCGMDTNKDHGIYAQNNTGSKLFAENILMNNGAYGFHLWAPNSQFAKNITMRGNVSAANGFLVSYGLADYFAGGGPDITGIVMDQNFGWRSNRNQFPVDLGSFSSFPLGTLTYTNNYMAGQVFFEQGTGNGQWSSVTTTGSAPTAGTAPNGNVQINAGGSPADQVFVRPNGFEPGRGNIIVYNYSLAASKNVDLSLAGVQVGHNYRIYRALDIWGTPVATGTYAGGTVSVPIASWAPPQPRNGLGAGFPTYAPAFEVFVVRSEAAQGGGGEPPPSSGGTTTTPRRRRRTRITRRWSR